MLLHAEQGLGDTLQFVRYVPMLAARGAAVTLAVQPPLKRLLAPVDGVSSIVSLGDRMPPHDLHCALPSLPAVFKTERQSIPARVPYIAAPEDALDKWRPRLPQAPGLRVAFAWSGSRLHSLDRHRSAPLVRLLPLLSAGTAQWVSIQREVRDEDADTLAAAKDIVHVGEELEDFCDAAAVLALCDLLITVDTSVAHLAGALGRPVWIMLPFSPDFRWMHGRSDSPWYPTARLFRQSAIDDWNGVLQDLATALATMADRTAGKIDG